MRYFHLLLSVLPALALAADPYSRFTEPDSGYDETLEVPWVEIETRVQEGPDDADLTELEIGNLPPGMTLHADLENLSVDRKDHVTRLWLVVRSDQGAYNASYEGVRCATREYKVYAYFNPGRSTPLRTVTLPRWRAIRPTGYRSDLAGDVLCSGTRPRGANNIRANPVSQAGDYDSPYE